MAFKFLWKNKLVLKDEVGREIQNSKDLVVSEFELSNLSKSYCGLDLGGGVYTTKKGLTGSLTIKCVYRVE